MHLEDLHKSGVIIRGQVHGEFVLDFPQTLPCLHIPLAALGSSFSENCEDFLAGESYSK